MANTPTEREHEGAWTKLGRRKIVQWGLAYAAAAWTLLQVIDHLTETYAWPPAIRQIATPALTLGSLVVLVLAWYHGEKGEQKVSRTEFAILILLATSVGGVLWRYGSTLDESAWVAGGGGPAVPHVVPSDVASVAVLPFANISGDPADEHFSDGLSVEIQDALARIPRLFVPARTSSFQFKGKSGDVAQIAAMLGVATVLEGSVQRIKGRVRISAQLVNAPDGKRLWSETYDRELKDVFAVEDEISGAIATALKVQLTRKQKAAVTLPRPTDNMDAYDAYLLGRFQLNQRGMEHVRESIPHFEKALTLDPKFAAAYADLAVAYGLIGICDCTPDAQALKAKARPAVDQAVALDPNRPEVLAAAGFTEWHSRLNRERGLQLIDASLAAQPNNGEALTWRALLLVQLGRYDEALEAFDESVKRDPLSALAVLNRAGVVKEFGKINEFTEGVERLRALNRPDWAEALLAAQSANAADRPGQFRHCILSTGGQDLSDCDGPLFASFGLREEEDRTAKAFRTYPWIVPLVLGDLQGALPMLQQAFAEGRVEAHWVFGVLWRLGRYAEAAALLPQVWKDGIDSDLGDNSVQLVVSADIARHVGRTKDASDYHDRASRMLTSLQHAGALTISTRALGWAMLHAYDGDEDAAAGYLIQAIQTDPGVWFYEPHNPLLKSIVQRTDVQAAIRQQAALVERQRPEVWKVLCGPDPVSKTFKPLPATCARLKNPA